MAADDERHARQLRLLHGLEQRQYERESLARKLEDLNRFTRPTSPLGQGPHGEEEEEHQEHESIRQRACTSELQKLRASLAAPAADAVSRRVPLASRCRHRIY